MNTNKVQKIYKVTTEDNGRISTAIFKKNAQKRDLKSGDLVTFDSRPQLPKGADPFQVVGPTIVSHLTTFKGKCKVTVHVRGKKFTKVYQGLQK
ncbi:hypothetical protein [Bdellovibrio sp. BCCA]|uniref:hypothetical protein n=1 Tax=Bdellovibrio sp. BCCA TaxID=3136281 RepID=UPI0030F2699F